MLKHISLTARDADQLAAFYKSVFGFTNRRPPKRLSGARVTRGNGLPGVEIYSIWLDQSDGQAPFLEILQYSHTLERAEPAVNAPGFGHLAFAVRDLQKTLADVLKFGGALQGEISNFGSEDQPYLIVYIRDPEGNILELEQPATRD